MPVGEEATEDGTWWYSTETPDQNLHHFTSPRLGCPAGWPVRGHPCRREFKAAGYRYASLTWAIIMAGWPIVMRASAKVSALRDASQIGST